MAEHSERPRIGVPWRTSKEETANNRSIVDKYLQSVERSGGDPVLVSLQLAEEELAEISSDLDAFVLTGSPADANPGLYGAPLHPRTAQADPGRERTDFFLIEYALASQKPLLGICFGAQLLNVFLGGSLVQDIPSEIERALSHSPSDELRSGARSPEVFHDAQFDAGRVRDLAGGSHTQVNSSHHQSILKLGRGLRITGRAADGVVEAVEWEGDPNWIVGVQWHPERLPDDALAQALFRELVAVARLARSTK